MQAAAFVRIDIRFASPVQPSARTSKSSAAAPQGPRSNALVSSGSRQLLDAIQFGGFSLCRGAHAQRLFKQRLSEPREGHCDLAEARQANGGSKLAQPVQISQPGKPDASPAQIFQSALNALDLFDSPEDVGSDGASYEDIAVDQQGAAASVVGRAVYEVLTLDHKGKKRKIYVKRRDLLRFNGLQPRDLRRIDPSLSLTKTSPNVTVKETCILINLGGVRAIISADRCALFEPDSPSSKKFLEVVTPRLVASEGARTRVPTARDHMDDSYGEENVPPFELEMLEGALMVATGRLDQELLSVTKRVTQMLQMLPRDITPVNLEELRRVKQNLVELESRADTLRDMLEEIMDDEEEVQQINLSSRPLREEQRRQRDRQRLEREMERGKARRDNAAEASMSSMDGASSSTSQRPSRLKGSATAFTGIDVDSSANPPSASSSGQGKQGSNPTSPSSQSNPDGAPSAPGSMPSTSDGASSRLGQDSAESENTAAALSSDPARSYGASPAADSSHDGSGQLQQLLQEAKSVVPGPVGSALPGSSMQHHTHRHHARRKQLASQRMAASSTAQRLEAESRKLEGEEWVEAQGALKEMEEAEEEAQELEEAEDLLEYYLQRAAGTQSEAERLLAGARDLEESIGVSLSARRFEVNRLELTLSIAGFAASIGAMVSSIFGMNLKSTLEESVLGFWGTTAAILLGCALIFWALYGYTRKRRIL